MGTHTHIYNETDETYTYNVGYADNANGLNMAKVFGHLHNLVKDTVVMYQSDFYHDVTFMEKIKEKIDHEELTSYTFYYAADDCGTLMLEQESVNRRSKNEIAQVLHHRTEKQYKVDLNVVKDSKSVNLFYWKMTVTKVEAY